MDSVPFTLDVALDNLSQAFTNIGLLIVAVSYVTGFFMFVKGVMMYRIFANQTFGSAQRGELAGPLVLILVGSLLFYFPSTLDTSLLTIFGSTSISSSNELVAYQSLQGSEQWYRVADVCIKYIKLVGYVAFVRGWIILSKMSNSGSQPGSVGKGAIHVIGGILLINIVDTFNLLATTFGYTG